MHKLIKGDQAGDLVKPYDYCSQLSQLAVIYKDKSEDDPDKRVSQEELLIDKAVVQAEEILNTARKESETIQEEARKNGYAEGLEEGRKAGYEEALKTHSAKMEQDREEIRELVGETIRDMEDKKQELLDNYLDDLKNVAVAVAEKVIRISLKSSGETIKLMIMAATSNLKKQEWAKIYISKYDVSMMMKADAEFLNALSYLSDNVKIITMENEEQGTCIVELPDETMDLSVNTQIGNIREIISNV